MVYPDPRDPRDLRGPDPLDRSDPRDPRGTDIRTPEEAVYTFTWIAIGLVALIAFFAAASFMPSGQDVQRTVNNTTTSSSPTGTTPTTPPPSKTQ